MRGKAIVTTLLLLMPVLVLAQTPAPAPGQPEHRMMMEQHRTGGPGGMGMDMGALVRPSAELLGEWWKNPELAAELRLTDAQVKQLNDAGMKTKLALIDTAADGLKALTRLQALLDADQIDEAAFNQQVAALSTDAGSVVKTFGQAALTIRRVLSAEQWKKFEALRHAHPPMPPRPMRPMQPGTPPPPSE